ncbi:MAG: YbaB/EbfC family nucleoid-associated protein [Chloroflexi bacterium]|nr:YbaB/EbfC family nucleoid-associated protein [Chloroflexota bacterium]
MGNSNLMRQMQNRLAKIQEELATETVEITAGGGAVKVAITGQQRVQAVTIDPSVVDPDDVEMLQDLMVAAFNEAIAKSQELAARRLSVLTGGMKIPGLG